MKKTKRTNMHKHKRGAVTRLFLHFAAGCVLLILAAPGVAWCDSGIFRQAGAADAESFRRGQAVNGAAGLAQVRPYMPGERLGELMRLEGAAAWRQLRDRAAETLAAPGLSSIERGWAYLYRGFGALGEHDLVAAGNDAGMARRLLPRELQPVLLLCLVKARQGLPREAEAYLKRHAQQGAPGSEAHAAMAAFYQDQGDWESAKYWYGEALRLAPDAARLNANLAVVLWRLGQASDAIGLMTKAVDLSPGNADFWNERGMLFLTMGNAQAALADFSAALNLDARHCGALLNRGNLFFYAGRPDLAEGDLSLGLRVYPRDVSLLTARARVYAGQGRYGEAKQDLEAALGVAEKDVAVLNDFAWFLATCPDSHYWNGPLAVEYALAAIAQDQTHDPGLYDTLAAARARAGDFKGATMAQDEALLKGRAHGLPEETLKPWEDRLRLYLKAKTYEQARL